MSIETHRGNPLTRRKWEQMQVLYRLEMAWEKEENIDASLQNLVRRLGGKPTGVSDGDLLEALDRKYRVAEYKK